MLLRIFCVVGCYAATAVALAQNATLAASIELFVFPAAGQDATLQSIDEAECYNWAVDRTGSDPFQLTQQAAQQAAAADRAMWRAEQAGQGAAGRSAAAGIITGALVGGVFGNRGRKSTRRAAATGALIGGASGSRQRSQAQSQATRSVASQAARQQANTEQQLTNFKNAFGACLEAKDYVARF